MATKKVRIGVLRVHIDSPTNGTEPSDQACREMFVANPAGNAVFQFWEQQSDGYLDLSGSDLLPWATITIPPETVLGVDSRSVVLDKARQATAPLLPPAGLDGYDGFVVLAVPRTRRMFDDAGNVVQGDIDTGSLRGICSILTPTNSHSFMLHEVGHTLGHDDAFGLTQRGTSRYGDPFCIMSALYFGNTNPTTTTTIPAIAGWPTTLNPASGPAASRAIVHFQWPDALDGHVRRLTTPQGGLRVPVDLAAAAGGGNQLIVVDPPGGVPDSGLGRVYVEYRPATGWDVGLTGGAGAAVVVHEVADGEFGIKARYRGHVPVPVGSVSDLSVPGRGLVVQVTDVRPDGVGVTLSSTVDRQVVLTPVDQPAATTVVSETSTRSDCGVLRSGTYLLTGEAVLQATTTGFGMGGDPPAAPPTLAWTVGGTAISDGGGNDVWIDGAGTPVEVVVRLSPDRTTLSVREIDEPVACRTTVTCTATGGGATVSASLDVQPTIVYTGMRLEDIPQYIQCVSRNMIECGKDPRDLDQIIADGIPDPFDGEMLIDRVRLQDALQEIASVDPLRAKGLVANADAALGPLDVARITPAFVDKFGTAAVTTLTTQIQAALQLEIADPLSG
jgi:hypothetical protein